MAFLVSLRISYISKMKSVQFTEATCCQRTPSFLMLCKSAVYYFDIHLQTIWNYSAICLLDTFRMFGYYFFRRTLNMKKHCTDSCHLCRYVWSTRSIIYAAKNNNILHLYVYVAHILLTTNANISEWEVCMWKDY